MIEPACLEVEARHADDACSVNGSRSGKPESPTGSTFGFPGTPPAPLAPEHAAPRALKFFESTSCSIFLPRLRSATSCLSFPFSASMIRSRRRSAIPSPANRFFHRQKVKSQDGTETNQSPRVITVLPSKTGVVYKSRMGEEGLEPSRYYSGNTPFSSQDSAESSAESDARSMCLDAIINSWGLLTADDRRRIIAIVNGRLA